MFEYGTLSEVDSIVTEISFQNHTKFDNQTNYDHKFN